MMIPVIFKRKSCNKKNIPFVDRILILLKVLNEALKDLGMTNMICLGDLMILDSSNAHKESYHIICKRIVAFSARKTFLQLVRLMEKKAILRSDDGHKLFIKRDEWRTSFLLDMAVYRRNALFRLPFNTKKGEQRFLKPVIIQDERFLVPVKKSYERMERIHVLVDHILDAETDSKDIILLDKKAVEPELSNLQDMEPVQRMTTASGDTIPLCLPTDNRIAFMVAKITHYLEQHNSVSNQLIVV